MPGTPEPRPALAGDPFPGRRGLRSSRPPLRSTPNVWSSRGDVYRAKLIFYLFLASLGVFFLAGMISYCVIRWQSFQPIQREYLPLNLPASFLYSTLALVFVSGFLQMAVACIRREQQRPFRTWLVLAWIAAAAFLFVQYFGMGSLLEAHFRQSDGSTKAYGLCFTLAFLHALHVFGGMIFLAFVIGRGMMGAYDHERHYAVEHCAAYWHFLDVIWLAMLATFLITA